MPWRTENRAPNNKLMTYQAKEDRGAAVLIHLRALVETIVCVTPRHYQRRSGTLARLSGGRKRVQRRPGGQPRGGRSK